MPGNARRLPGNSLPFRTPFFYGWMMVAVAALGIFFSGPGQTYSNSVYIASYIEAFGMSQTEVASIYSAATFVSGMLLFAMGKLTDKYGRRAMLTIAAVMLGLSCLFNSLVTGPVMLFFGFFLIRYFGQGSMTLLPNTLVSQWFVAYRGRALAFAALGGLLGAAAFPPLINALIGAWGWQSSWRIIGVAILLLFAPVAFLLVRDRPEEAGLLPDGAKASDEASASAIQTHSQEDSWLLKEAAGTRSFWLIMLCCMIPSMVNTGITFQIFSILGEKMIDRHTTAFLLGLTPLVSFGCSLLAGFVSERILPHRLLAITFAINIIPPVILMTADHFAGALAFAICWGAAWGFISIPLGLIWPHYYGRKHLGSIQGVAHAATVIGSALGPIPFGWAFDRFGSYTAILAASAAIWAAGAALSLFASAPRRNQTT